MQIKEAKPINFLYFEVVTKVNELHNFLPVGQKLFRAAVDLSIAITGPVHWHYFGFAGDINQAFTLQICLPVADLPDEYDGEFHVKRTETFKCVSMIHEGNWLQMPETYGKLMQFMEQHKLQPALVNREIYINADFKYPDANVTEVQIGIK